MFIFIKVKCIIVCEQEFDYFGVKQFTFVDITLNARELHKHEFGTGPLQYMVGLGCAECHHNIR